MRQLLLLIFTLTTFAASAQQRYVDGAILPLYGKGDWATESRYDRLPAYLHGSVRDQLWNLGTNSSGLYLRFRSNSTSVGARWTVRDNVSMNHMTDTGIKGLDLYAYQDGEWRFVNSARPSGKSSSATIIENMEPQMREYMLYLPLYDGVDSLSIAVDSVAIIEGSAIDLPATDCPMVFYGTSIMQGACASRPGMSPTAILSRRMNREAINLGFSGNGKLDLEVAGAMASIKNPHCFVLDFVPNCTVGLIDSNMLSFVAILRGEHPNVPIVIVENALFPTMLFDKSIQKNIMDKNRALRLRYEELKRGGDQNLHYVTADKLLGTDSEATIDGVHSTDVGFMRYCDRLSPVLSSVRDH